MSTIETPKQQSRPLPVSPAPQSEDGSATNTGRLTKDRLLSCFRLGAHTPSNLRDEDFKTIFLEEPKKPLNLNERHQYFHGDLIIEMYGKYKNYYKKTFNPQQITSPFTASQIVDDEKARVWIYIDESDYFQGPFTSVEMDHWYNSELLPLDLLIGMLDRDRCVKLSDFISSTYPFDKNPDIYHVKRTPKTQPAGDVQVKAFTFNPHQ